MPYASEEAQAEASKAWYEDHRQIVIDRKSARIRASRNLVWLFVAESMTRWVSPDEMREACKKVASEYRMRNTDQIVDRLPPGALGFGLLAGEAPFQYGDMEAEELRAAIKKPWRRRIPIELFILNLQIQKIKRTSIWNRDNW